MPNADNTHGTFNKLTKILSQVDDGSTALQNFSNVEEAKSWFFTPSALTVFDECCSCINRGETNAMHAHNAIIKTVNTVNPVVNRALLLLLNLFLLRGDIRRPLCEGRTIFVISRLPCLEDSRELISAAWFG